MIKCNFYFLNDQYFIDFPDEKLMKNKENIHGVEHGRPCYYAYEDPQTCLYWLIPISSQVSKFRRIHDEKVNKYGQCDTIVFGKVLGHEKAFLIQNMCPVTNVYISNEYIDSTANIPVRVDGILEKELKTKVSKVLTLYKRGSNLIFPDVMNIEKKLRGNSNKQCEP